jgi:acyl-coenzyme A thioesterase PaaI-like protein
MDLESSNEILAEIRDVRFPHNRMCGSANEHGLRLVFSMADDGDVTASLDCHPTYQGFPGIVHGGVLAAMLDSAMSNCMFARKIDAVTAEMTVRYSQPVRIHGTAVVRARIDKSTSRLHFLSAEILQNGVVAAAATAKFMNLSLDQPSPPCDPSDGA